MTGVVTGICHGVVTGDAPGAQEGVELGVTQPTLEDVFVNLTGRRREAVPA